MCEVWPTPGDDGFYAACAGGLIQARPLDAWMPDAGRLSTHGLVP